MNYSDKDLDDLCSRGVITRNQKRRLRQRLREKERQKGLQRPQKVKA